MEKLLKNTSGLLLVMILALFVSVPASAGTTGLISIDELKAMIDDPDLVILMFEPEGTGSPLNSRSKEP